MWSSFRFASLFYTSSTKFRVPWRAFAPRIAISNSVKSHISNITRPSLLVAAASVTAAPNCHSTDHIETSSNKPHLSTIAEVPTTQVEPRTGLSLQTKLSHDRILIGTAARSVTIFGFLTYALGLYTTETRWKFLSSTLDSSQILSAFVSQPEDTTLTINAYRAIDCTHFCGSISSGLTPLLTKQFAKSNLSEEEALKASEQVLAEFRSFFSTKNLPEKTVIEFYVRKTTTSPHTNPTLGLEISIDGVSQGIIQNTVFATSFIDLFLGEYPRSVELKDGLIKSMDNLRKTTTL